MKRLVAVSVLCVVACGGSDTPTKDTVVMSMPSAQRTEPEDIAITTTDGSMTMAVRGDSLRLRLSDATREKVRAELDTSKVEGNGFGARISKALKSKVSAGIGVEMAIPLSTIKDARLNGSRLVIESTQTGKELFDGTQAGGKPLGDAFSSEDAKRLIDFLQTKIAAKK
ncbi:MAG: hypothetical protein WCL36_00850 [bacterium]